MMLSPELHADELLIAIFTLLAAVLIFRSAAFA